MSPSFLVFANLWLLGRLIVFFRDDAVNRTAWMVKAAAELAALFVLFPMGPAWAGAAASVVVLDFLGHRLEQRPGRKDLARLGVGMLGLAVWSVWFAPGSGLGFRPEIVGWVARAERWTALAPVVEWATASQLQLVVFGLLLSANEANLVIRAVFDRLDLKPRALPADGGAVDLGELNRGRIIGILERGLLYAFVLQGQYGAIGFILAAKAFTRFKALDNRAFAEYVLIGTLLSACLALATGVLVRALLRS
jgi:hypothetical protein